MVREEQIVSPTPPPRRWASTCTITLNKETSIMAGKKTAVFGIYHTAKQAERSVDDLLVAGFSNDDISVLFPDNQGSKDFAHEKNTKAPEGTTAGVTAGGAIGGTLGLLGVVAACAVSALCL